MNLLKLLTETKWQIDFSISKHLFFLWSTPFHSCSRVSVLPFLSHLLLTPLLLPCLHRQLELLCWENSTVKRSLTSGNSLSFPMTWCCVCYEHKKINFKSSTGLTHTLYLHPAQIGNKYHLKTEWAKIPLSSPVILRKGFPKCIQGMLIP